MPDRASFVTRCIRPGAAGTLKLLLKHGTDLVCVRYRESADGAMRMTTVELVVDRRPTARLHCLVAVRWDESDLRKRLSQEGATWDPTRRCWIVQPSLVKRLKLQSRVIGCS